MRVVRLRSKLGWIFKTVTSGLTIIDNPTTLTSDKLGTIRCSWLSEIGISDKSIFRKPLFFEFSSLFHL